MIEHAYIYDRRGQLRYSGPSNIFDKIYVKTHFRTFSKTLLVNDICFNYFQYFITYTYVKH